MTCVYRLPDAWETAVDGWLRYLVAGGIAAPTRQTRRRHVRSVARLIGSAHPRDVTTDDLLGALSRPEHSADHRRGMRSSLGLFYRWAVKFGVVADDPAAALPSVRASIPAPRPATDRMWSAILECVDPRALLMARLAAEAGLRRAEVAKVHTNDLVETGDGAQLIVHGKGGKQRVVPINASLARAITTQAETGYLFPGRIDGHIGADHVGKLVSQLMPNGWSMHKLRHRAATRGYSATGNLRAVQEFLGHASVATTQRYTAVAAREIRAVSEAAAWQPDPVPSQ